MSDTVALAIISAVVTISTLYIKDWIDGRRIERSKKEVKEAVEENTNVTINQGQALYKKVESATKEVNEQATAAAQIATKAVTQNVLVSHRMIEQTKELTAKTAVIEDRLNGGPGGLHELSLRVAKVEGQVEVLVTGHAKVEDQVGVLVAGHKTLIQSMDHFSEVLERKLG